VTVRFIAHCVATLFNQIGLKIPQKYDIEFISFFVIFCISFCLTAGADMFKKFKFYVFKLLDLSGVPLMRFHLILNNTIDW
jgi:hypothetical protein